MNFRLCIFILLIISNLSYVYGQKYTYHAKYITLLDSSKGKKCLRQCSRAIPDNISGFFNISKSDSLKVVTNLKKATLITDTTGGLTHGRVRLKQFDRSCFQLLGVIIRGERYIYLNVFGINFEDDLKTYLKDWRTEPIIICDGGSWEWGVLFDPKKSTFSDLSLNGVG